MQCKYLQDIFLRAGMHDGNMGCHLTKCVAERGSGKTRSVTFRIPEELYESLQKEAVYSNVSFSALATKVFRRHVDWHSMAARAGWIYVTRSTFSSLLERLSDSELQKLAQASVSANIRDILLFMKSDKSLDAALHLLETWFRINELPYRLTVQGNRYTITTQHNMGHHFSVYLAEFLKSACMELGINNIAGETAKNSLLVTFTA